VPPPTQTQTTTQQDARPTSGPELGQSTSTDAPQSSSSPQSSESSTSGGASNTSGAASASASASGTGTSTTDVPNLGPAQTSDGAPSATSEAPNEAVLPIQPQITPALGFGGVILLLTGIAYLLVGVKHRLAQIFLSSGYLAALAVTVLIDFLMKPPVGNAIQGAYFVAIFMSGALFGAGSLLFQEVAEGFGCLLGGFCLAMWFLCLKPGGLVTSQTGTGIMVGVFCIAVWSLSFSHWTRNYGLIGSTSFAGATASVLGIDCFSRAGLKEFWFYIWQLNGGLFPLGTDTYPLTRGMIVELIVIILATIVGVLSQIKLWKIVRARRARRDAEKLEDERRKTVVEEVIGRQLERQNDRDRATWEKQYGNKLYAKRSTILWSEAHPDKSVTHVLPYEDKRMSSVDSLELSSVSTNSGKRRSNYGSKNKRESSVSPIPEESEEAEAIASTERQKALETLDANMPAASDAGSVRTAAASARDEEISVKAESAAEAVTTAPEVTPLPFKVPLSAKSSESDMSQSIPAQDADAATDTKRNSRTMKPSKRRSLLSMLSMSPRLSTSSERLVPTKSAENLMAPSPNSSRASSIAATLDEENDRIRMSVYIPDQDAEPQTPTIVISPVDAPMDQMWPSQHPVDLSSRTPPSPQVVPVELDEVEEDPEEMPRLPEKDSKADDTEKAGKAVSTASGGSRGLQSSSSDTHHTTGQTSLAEGLTKGALEQVPRQTSHIVLSYRTNEWAKHIAEADAPVFTEPEQIGEEAEPATQLAPPSEAATPSSPTDVPAMGPMPLVTAPPSPILPPPVASAGSEGIAANIPEPQRRASQASSMASMGAVMSAPIVGPVPTARPSVKSQRSTSHAQKSPNAVTPINENEIAQFVNTQQAGRGSTSTLQRVASPPPVMTPVRSGSAMSGMISGRQSPYVYRSNSSTSLGHYPDQRHISRSSSMMSGVNMAMRSDTRLDSYESRQPQKRDLNGEQQRREALLTEWRASQAHGGLINQIPSEQVKTRRAQMMLDREHKRLVEDHERAMNQQKQFAMDQMMRRPDVQDLHRQAMRKMQADANRKC
jgi:hypothetical protein